MLTVRKKRIPAKGFSGLVRYGQARHAMYCGWASNLRKLAAQCSKTHLEQMQQRAYMQRQFRPVH